MPIDVSVKRSPGWWLQRLMNKLNDRERRRRLQLLHDYRMGNAPLPEGADPIKDLYSAFQKKSRSNFAELVVAAASHRMVPVGFQTALDDDVTGDAEVGELWERAGLDVSCSTVHDMMLGVSEAYVIVGAVDEDTEAPLITPEDARWMVGEADPASPERLMAALKVMVDDADGEYRAYLYLPGSATNSGLAEIWVAVRPMSSDGNGSPAVMWKPAAPYMNFSAKGWDWDPERSATLPHPKIPVVRFLNKDGMGEFEPHLDILDRINHQILWRLSIALLQAYKQRAVKGLPVEDDEGEPIDYSDVFTADPAALWQLPQDAEMWESQEVNLQPILSAVKDDVQHLSAVTQTPMHVLAPESANQSAEGANLVREQLIFKVQDRNKRTGRAWARVMSLALLQTGDSARADLAKLKTRWAPPDRLSLAEKASADAQAQATIPQRSRLIHIWGFSPAEADRIMTESTEEKLLNIQMAQAMAAAQAVDQAQQSPDKAKPVGDQFGGTGGKDAAAAAKAAPSSKSDSGGDSKKAAG